MTGTSSPTTGAALAAVIVPRSAVDRAADPEKAHDLVQAVIDFVNAMTGEGLYSRSEIPEKALQVYHADYYLAQVNNGGHSQFIHNGHKNLDYILADARAGLFGMNAQAHLFLLERMAAWIAENPGEAGQQTGFDGGRAMTLDQLDALFYRADRAAPMIAQSARWIAAWPELSVVEDAACREALRQAGSMNPLREPRLLARSVASLARQMTEWFHVGVGLACANAPVTEVKLKIGGGAVEKLEGRNETAFVVRTNAALRYCVITKTHAAAYERVEHDNPPMPKFGDAEGMVQAMRDGRLARYKPPTVGRKLSHVPAETIERVIAAAEVHRAPVALDLLLRRAGIETKDASVAPLSAEPCRPAGIVVKWLVAAGGHPLFAVSRPEGSLLLRAADNQQIAAAVMADVVDHAARAEAGAVEA